MGKIIEFEERVVGRDEIDGAVYDPNYIPAEEDEVADLELMREKFRKMGTLPPDMWVAEDFRNYYEIKKREVGKKKAWEMLYVIIKEIIDAEKEEAKEDEYGFVWAKTDWSDFGGEIRKDLF